MSEAKKPEWQDITREAWRAYLFPGGNWVRIDNPVKLLFQPNGEHWIVTADGQAHVIPYGWTHLRWQPKPGQEPF